MVSDYEQMKSPIRTYRIAYRFPDSNKIIEVMRIETILRVDIDSYLDEVMVPARRDRVAQVVVYYDNEHTSEIYDVAEWEGSENV